MVPCLFQESSSARALLAAGRPACTCQQSCSAWRWLAQSAPVVCPIQLHHHPPWLQALERIAGLLEGCTSSIVLAERGDAAPVTRHPGFRLLAAMNPATDAGKRDLPAPLRNRFTEVQQSCTEDTPVIVAALAGVLQLLHGCSARQRGGDDLLS